MFRKFTKEDVHSRSNIKSSVQRGLKTKFVSQFPGLEGAIDNLIPKKSQAEMIKCEERVQLYSVDGDIVLFQHFDDLIPTLRVVHKYADCFPKVQVDRGAIKFVLSGANVMCPGLTSQGGKLPEENIEVDSIVTIYAEGKDSALAIGKLLMSTDDMKLINKGHGIELLHYLGDGLWNLERDD
jgi:PUA domain protein